MIASPFWPEGDDPASPVVELVQRFGQPEQVRLVCQASTTTVSGAPIPVLPAALPRDLKARLRCEVIIQPSRRDVGVEEQDDEEAGETTEDDVIVPEAAATPEARRSLHAKIIVVRGTSGSVLYVGSSNCTRRGLGLTGRDRVVPRV